MRLLKRREALKAIFLSATCMPAMNQMIQLQDIKRKRSFCKLKKWVDKNNYHKNEGKVFNDYLAMYSVIKVIDSRSLEFPNCDYYQVVIDCQTIDNSGWRIFPMQLDFHGVSAEQRDKIMNDMRAGSFFEVTGSYFREDNYICLSSPEYHPLSFKLENEIRKDFRSAEE